MEYINKYLSFNGCIKRKEFFFIFIAFVCLSFAASTALSFYVKNINIETIPQLNMFLISKSILMVFLTLIWLPAIVKRLHDIGTSGLWALLLIPSHLLDFRNILLFKETIKIEFTVPLPVHYLNIAISLVFLVVLFFMPSNYISNKHKSPNKALKRDAEKASRPLA